MSQIEQDYKLVENEGLFQEYLEMGAWRTLDICWQFSGDEENSTDRHLANVRVFCSKYCYC